MQIENDYDKEVYNGDIGYIADVDPDERVRSAIEAREHQHAARLIAVPVIEEEVGAAADVAARAADT